MSTLSQYLDISNQKLEEIVIMVRGQLSKMDRITLEALIVIDVHCKYCRINAIFFFMGTGQSGLN